MKINVKVISNAKERKIVRDGSLKIYVNSPASKGKANSAIIELLAEFFKVHKSKIKILRGEKSRNKIIEIED